MVIVLIITLIVAQICLIEWKKRHYRSYSVSKCTYCSSIYLLIILAYNTVRNVVSTYYTMPKKSLVEVYIYMVIIFLYNGPYCQKSPSKTNRKNHTKVEQNL